MTEFLRNYWYVAAWRKELTVKPLQRWILGEPIVLFRTEGGKVGALVDRCPHRGAALSLGRVTGEAIECGYHGLTFDSCGQCVRVPGQARVPPSFKTRSYPVVEKWRWVFIWMGEPDKADPAQIPDFHWQDDPEWIARGELLPVKANYTLIRDNLLDLSHAHFVHKKTLATDAVVKEPIRVESDNGTIKVIREMRDIEPSPLFRKAGGFQGRVNHKQVVNFNAPANIVIETTVSCIHDPKNIADLRVMNAITPESESSTHYFWSLGRNFNLQDDELTDFIFEANKATFFEDVSVIENQQQMLEAVSLPEKPLLFHVDGGVERVQQHVHRLLNDQQKGG